jgi:sulfatase maturation enzyme AslB (radical SAM superfamily)
MIRNECDQFLKVVVSHRGTARALTWFGGEPSAFFVFPAARYSSAIKNSGIWA